MGALLALVREWRSGSIGTVLAFGAGALVSSVAFELAEGGAAHRGPRLSGHRSRGRGRRLFRRGPGRQPHRRSVPGGGSAGLPLALGSLLDGIPEQAVLGIGLATGKGVSVALLVAILISNLPEAIGSASDMRRSGRRQPGDRRRRLR